MPTLPKPIYISIQSLLKSQGHFFTEIEKKNLKFIYNHRKSSESNPEEKIPWTEEPGGL